MAYNVKLEIFEGPLDLLLHLIKKSEVDIYDIPISTITEQYLKYLDILKSLNLNMAGEFLVMAASLVHIKSKMLLPPSVDDTDDDDDDEGLDPRGALIRKLLEYQRFKEAGEELFRRLVLGRDVFARGQPLPLDDFDEDDGDLGFGDVSMYDLMEAFREILKRVPDTYSIDLTVDKFRIKDKINEIMERLSGAKSVLFSELFRVDSVRGEVIVTFLAVLELAKLLMIRLNQSDEGAIRVYTTSPDGAPAGDVIQAGDDG